jgi:uncharacterized protein with LGFP repeats
VPTRRPAPTILFTAVAATLILLPWALDDSPGDEAKPPPVTDAQLAQQPLHGLGSGVTTREISQHTPFSMVALTGADLAGTSARVRAKHADGSWGPWYDAETLETGAGASSGTGGTEPVFVGATTTVQIAVNRPDGAPVTSPPPGHEPAKPGLGYRPATVEQPFGQNVSAVLISPPRAPVDTQWSIPTAVVPPGQPPHIISRAQWGASDTSRCGRPKYNGTVRAAVVHHTAGSNNYAPEDSPGIVQGIYAYHTRTLGWCDIAYNALVDKYGQVFEGRAGGVNKPVEGAHTGGFNRDTWGVAMLGDFEDVPPTPIQLHTTGRLLGWRMSLAGVDPLSTATLVSAGGANTHFPRGVAPTLPSIFTHRDVGNTACPGDASYALLNEIRDTAARFNSPPRPEDMAEALEGGAIHARWQQMGAMDGLLGAPTSPESAAEGAARYATFDRGAVYWSPATDAQPLTGAIYEAWAWLGYERGALGLPTSAEISEPLWIGQNFQHGTLNFDRQNGTVTRVVDGIAEELPPPADDNPPVQIERFSRPISPA